MKSITKPTKEEITNKGITLIALVITIIVLLILAGVTIATLTGNNGVLTKANKAKTENEKMAAKEKVQIAVMGSFDESGKIAINEVKNNLKKTEGVKGAENITKLPATVEVDGYEVTIDKKGNVILGTVEEQLEPIYARLYNKNGSEDQVLVLASDESVIPDYSGELTLKQDFGDLYGERKKFETKEDLYQIPEYKETLESEEWKQYEAENPEEAEKTIEEILIELNTLRSLPAWNPFVGGTTLENFSLVEVRILNEICPNYMEYWFQNCKGLKEIIGIENLNTSNVTSMRCMFSDCINLTRLDLRSFNTSNVTAMDFMFYKCANLTTLNLNSFDTSNVTNMDCMFNDCTNLTKLDLRNFNTSNVTSMHAMFDGCSNLTTLNLSSFATSNVTNMNYMFSGCTNLTTLDLRSFSIANINSVGHMAYIFYNCSSLSQILVSSLWVFPENWNTGNIFANCPVSSVTYVE